MKIRALQDFSSSDCKGKKGKLMDLPVDRANWLVENGYCAHLEAPPGKVVTPAKPKKK